MALAVAPSVSGQDLSHLWSQGFGGTGGDRATAAAVDGAGNILVTGYFFDTVSFGGDPITAVARQDIFVAKYAPDGTHLRSQGFGGGGTDEAYGIAVDGLGNVVITGKSNGSPNLGGGSLPNAGLNDIFLAKYGPDGTHLWSQGFGGTGGDEGHAVAVDAAGNVVLTGRFSDTVSFGGDPITATRVDIFLAKYAPDGTHLWSQGFSGTSINDEAWAVAVDGGGNIVLTGSFEETVGLGGSPLTSVGQSDIFLAKYAPDGTHLWSRAFGDTIEDFGRAVATDPAGNAIVTGDFQGNVSFGGDPIAGGGMFLAKYAPDGTHLWSEGFAQSRGYAIAADAAANVAVTGEFGGTTSFGGDPVTAVGRNDDIFVAKYRLRCDGDVNADRSVDVLDLLAVLAAWGPCTERNCWFLAQVTYPTGDGPYSVAVGDLDGDVDLDLALSNDYSDNVSVLLNNGDGTFAPQATYATGDLGISVVAADLDGDLDLDLAVANFNSGNVSVLLNNGSGTFAAQVLYGVGDAPFSVAAGDLDGDLDLDLAVPNRDGNTVSVLLNNGNGTFAAHLVSGAGDGPYAVAVGDLDGDLDPDLAVANSSSDDVSVLLNNGNGTFAPHVLYGAGDAPQSVAVGDLDGDLDLDIAVGNRRGANLSVLSNNGDGTFAPHHLYNTGDIPRSVAVGDLDGDLDMDLAVANWGVDNVGVFMNRCVPDCPSDVNGDGTVDVLDLLQLLAGWGPCP